MSLKTLFLILQIRPYSSNDIVFEDFCTLGKKSR